LEVPLITEAMLEELSRNDKQSKNNQSEVSKYFYDNIYAKSKKYKLDSNESIYLPVWKSVVDHIESLDAKSVLDIGCGPGQFAEYLFSRMPEIIYTGIDFSEVAINQAKERCSKGQFLVNNIMEKDIFKNFNTDVYIVLEVLEHIEQDREIISSIMGNKEVIFSVPNFDSFGHVRFFRDENQVKERYDYEFEELRIQSILLNGRSKIFLSSGLRIKN
jgi:2-polyprenyl-3-methyl-5-hydroxy-6-metoxy-1,4-benzoquinol methylase